jgi:hypothetical protein
VQGDSKETALIRIQVMCVDALHSSTAFSVLNTSKELKQTIRLTHTYAYRRQEKKENMKRKRKECSNLHTANTETRSK